MLPKRISVITLRMAYKSKEDAARYNREWYFSHKKSEGARKKRERKNAIAAGLCGRCRHRPKLPDILLCSWCVEQMRALDRKRSVRDKEIVVKAYGGKCSCCGESKIEFMSIDHPNGDGHEHRRRGKDNARNNQEKTGAGIHIYRWLKRNNFPSGYRLLCFNCNCSRGFFGYCPHERERQHITVVA